VRELFHISSTDAWAADQRAGAIIDSTRNVTLEQEGFIHCSYAEQVAETARRVYGDLDEVIVVRIDPGRLSSPVVEEDLAGSGEPFPHVYGPIGLDAVIEARAVRPDEADADT
jgi:uncharacterized protein (DUF952 family)